MDTPLQGKRLLVVEDDPEISELLTAFLSGKGGAVEQVSNGRLALETLKKSSPDLILLDVVLPEKDGFTILEELRSQGNRTPVIVLTDQATLDDKVKGLSIGADDYITKPFSTRELLARLISLFRRMTPPEEPTELTVGPLRLNQAARELSNAHGDKIPLTKTEFDLFAYLARRHDQAVTHRNLLEDVMGYRGDVETKALIMHVANMRRKLTAAGIESLSIESVPGVGYKLRTEYPN